MFHSYASLLKSTDWNTKVITRPKVPSGENTKTWTQNSGYT